jgi:hypothetical protein
MYGSIAAFLCVNCVLAADVVKSTPQPAELPQKASAASTDATPKSKQTLEIEQRLQTPVEVHYQNVPRIKVLDDLTKRTKIPIHLDPKGLAEEGVQLDEPVMLDLTSAISVDSAFRLILRPLHLNYHTKDEVLWISGSLKNNTVLSNIYHVDDLAPSSEAMKRLVERIYSEVNPETWEKTGGHGSIIQLNTYSIRVKNTQEVLENLADFLHAERRLQWKMTPEQKYKPEERLKLTDPN